MMTEEQSRTGPHQGQPILVAGEQLEGDPLEQTHVAMILLHGRGATAASMLELAAQWNQPDFTYLAPQAAGNSWYPYSFLAPLASNEPFLSSALTLMEDLLERIAQSGIPPERTMLCGFSQGACLALEFTARHARRYGGVVGLSGGLIGPDDTPRNYTGSLAGTPVFLGCSDSDPHIPLERVRLSDEVLRRLGGEVTMRLYRGMGHTINQDEMETVRQMMGSLVARSSRSRQQRGDGPTPEGGVKT
jgi:phospholipase/carboxylesterase